MAFYRDPGAHERPLDVRVADPVLTSGRGARVSAAAHRARRGAPRKRCRRLEGAAFLEQAFAVWSRACGRRRRTAWRFERSRSRRRGRRSRREHALRDDHGRGTEPHPERSPCRPDKPVHSGRVEARVVPAREGPKIRPKPADSHRSRCRIHDDVAEETQAARQHVNARSALTVRLGTFPFGRSRKGFRFLGGSSWVVASRT